MPHSFTDAKGREWPLEITVATLKRMRLLANGFQLDDVVPKEMPTPDKAQAVAQAYVDFLNDDERFSNVLWAIVKPIADERKITQEQFDEGLTGEANQRAILAFHTAFQNFSHDPRKTMLRGVKIGLKKMQAATAKLATELTDEKLEAAIEQSIEASRTDAGGLPESSASTPAIAT